MVDVQSIGLTLRRSFIDQQMGEGYDTSIADTLPRRGLRELPYSGLCGNGFHETALKGTCDQLSIRCGIDGGKRSRGDGARFFDVCLDASPRIAAFPVRGGVSYSNRDDVQISPRLGLMSWTDDVVLDSEALPAQVKA